MNIKKTIFLTMVKLNSKNRAIVHLQKNVGLGKGSCLGPIHARHFHAQYFDKKILR